MKTKYANLSNRYMPYIPVDPKYSLWGKNWVLYGATYDCPRRMLYRQIIQIRKENGSKSAVEFVYYLHWLGVYPARIPPG